MSNKQCKFIWFDLMTTDMKAAEAFYKEVVGWDAATDTTTGQPYTLFSMGKSVIAGLMAVPPDAAERGARPGWSGYIGVDDVDENVGKVTAAGGSILRPASDIPGVGRFAVMADPHGAMFILFKGNGTPQPPPTTTNDPGWIGWNELHAGDLATEWAFYSELFGWVKERDVDMGPMGVYRVFGTGGAGGGMMTKMAQVPHPFWLYYINVSSVDAAVERIKAGGGQVTMGPHEVPGGSWIVQGMDPQGAVFAVVSQGR